MNSTNNNKYVGTVPHSIAEAIEICKNERNPTCHPIDLLAIVTDIEKSSTTGSASYHQRSTFVRLWIIDASCLTHTNSRIQILCFGHRRYNELIETLQIRSGDIIRFNRVTTLPTNHNDNVTTFSNDNYNVEISGPEYYRFGNVFDYDDDKNACNEVIIQNRLQERDEIPLSMRTNPTCMLNLIVWYRSVINDHKVLDSLPCQHRTLLEFLSYIGLPGHTTANVVQIEQLQEQPTNRVKNKKTFVTVIQPSKTLLVTLMDDCSSTSATFVIESASTNRYAQFKTILLQAQASNQPVVITNILSVKNQQLLRNYRGPNLLPDTTDGILIPTFKSDVRIIEHPLAEGSRNKAGLSPTPNIFTPPTQNENNGISSEVLCIKSPIFDIGMFTSRDGRRFLLVDGSSSTGRNDKFTLDALISSSMMTTSSSVNDDYSRDSGYVSVATIQLRMDDVENEIVNVEANAAIIQCLCGGGDGDIEAVGRQLAEQNNSRNYDTNTKLHKLRILLLHNMIRERIELQWILQKITTEDVSIPNTTGNKISYQVLKVWLLEL